ncbi:hypothetical protein ES332_D11G249600v1 [Gossypium tomentosum]|uniref:Uncharacterized protein n=1 Tax=Gossypium tomentosum TaxID=34277 RepID=A0A5D2IRH1_GOSTO|nr:hypothetical protein ES332_D11G249600v1 [Gossypium tomentosum]
MTLLKTIYVKVYACNMKWKWKCNSLSCFRIALNISGKTCFSIPFCRFWVSEATPPPAFHFLIDLEPSFFVLDLGFELMEIGDSRLFGQVLHVGKKLDRVDDFLQFLIIVHSRRPSYFFSFLKYLIV